jgi:hypothetical protein
MSTDNLHEDQERAASERERLVALYGEDITIGLATDTPAQSRRPSSAQTIVKERNDALAELQREDREAQLAVAAGFRADADAFDRVTADPSTATDADKRAALRHALRHNLVPAQTSAEKLIAQDQRLRRRTS